MRLDRMGGLTAGVVVLAVIVSGAAHTGAQGRGLRAASSATRPGQRRLRRFVRFVGRGPVDLADSRATSWQVWWELNKETYIGLARRAARGKRATAGGGEPFLGKGRAPRPGARPFGGDLRIRLIRPDLEIALRDEKTLVRVSAAYALGLLGDRRATGALIRAVGDGGSEVQDAALLSLGMVGGAEAVRVLTSVLVRDATAAKLLRRDAANDQRRATAAMALGMSGDRSAFPPLARAVARRRESREVRAASVIGLGLLGAGECEVLLVKVFRRRRARTQIQALAATSLGRIGGPLSRAVLLQALRHKQTEVRRAAALALGGVARRTPWADELRLAMKTRAAAKDVPPETLAKLEAYVKELEAAAASERAALDDFDRERRRALRAAALGDAEYAVREFAAIALGQSGRAADRDVLFSVMESDITELRPFAALALGILGARGGDKDGAAARLLLAEFKREGRLDHKIAFALALGMRGWLDAGAAIRKALRGTKEPLSRSHYALALGMMGYAPALADVVETLKLVRERDEVELSAMAYGLLADGPSADRLAKVLRRNRDRYATIGAGVSLAFFGRGTDLRRLARYIRDLANPAVTRAFIIEGLGVAGDVRDPTPLQRLAFAHNFFVAFDGIDRAIQRKW